MKRQLLHTPEGVRDIYNDECEKKLILQDELLKVQKQYGYHPIQTPTFEFFDTFGREIGTTPSKDLYKFFDREGNTLVLRPDITPSIARCAAMYFGEEKMPIRLCYMGNTFLNNSSYQGRLKESTQLGAELLGDSTVDADAEIIAMVIDCLKKAGLKEFLLCHDLLGERGVQRRRGVCLRQHLGVRGAHEHARAGARLHRHALCQPPRPAEGRSLYHGARSLPHHEGSAQPRALCHDLQHGQAYRPGHEPVRGAHALEHERPHQSRFSDVPRLLL